MAISKPVLLDAVRVPQSVTAVELQRLNNAVLAEKVSGGSGSAMLAPAEPKVVARVQAVRTARTAMGGNLCRKGRDTCGVRPVRCKEEARGT